MATLQDFSQQEEFSVLRLEATAYATATVSNHALLLQLRLSLKLSDKCSQVFPIFAFIIFQPGIRLYQWEISLLAVLAFTTENESAQEDHQQ